MISRDQAAVLYTDHDSAHGFDHVERVWRLALRIAEEEGANIEVVNDAALLHDVGRAQQLASGGDHAEIGAEVAAQLLAEAPFAHREAVCAAIREHRFRTERHPSSLEAQVLFDADKLDALGAIGVARAYAVGGALRQHLWGQPPDAFTSREPTEGMNDHQSDEHTPVHEYVFKLSRLHELVVTPTARRMALERHGFMAAFFEQLGREVSGEV